MKNNIKSELIKALHNRMFYIALLLGVLVSIINIVENIQQREIITEILLRDRIGISKNYESISLFINWIAVDAGSLGYRIYYFIWPILAALPFGWSYHQDRKNGVFNQIVSRSNLHSYYISKYIAVFVSGGLAVAVPIVFNLLINALICPYNLPRVITSLVAVFDGSFMSELFYTKPWIYAVIWCVVDFFFGGLAACFCFVIGTKPRLQTIVILTPYILFVLLDSAISFLENFINISIELSPLRLAAAVTPNQNPEWIVLCTIVILSLGSFAIGYWQVKKHELA